MTSWTSPNCWSNCVPCPLPRALKPSSPTSCTTRWAPRCAEVRRDPIGNVIARVGGSGPRVLLQAHMDQVGYVVRHVTEDGFVLLDTAQGDRRTGPERRHPVGQPVRVLTRDGSWLEGILAASSGHVLTAKQRESTSSASTTSGSSWADEPRRDPRRRRARRLAGRSSPRPRARVGDLLVGPAMDNRVGLALMDALIDTDGLAVRAVAGRHHAGGERPARRAGADARASASTPRSRSTSASPATSPRSRSASTAPSSAPARSSSTATPGSSTTASLSQHLLALAGQRHARPGRPVRRLRLRRPGARRDRLADRAGDRRHPLHPHRVRDDRPARPGHDRRAAAGLLLTPCRAARTAAGERRGGQATPPRSTPRSWSRTGCGSGWAPARRSRRCCPRSPPAG